VSLVCGTSVLEVTTATRVGRWRALFAPQVRCMTCRLAAALHAWIRYMLVPVPCLAVARGLRVLFSSCKSRCDVLGALRRLRVFQRHWFLVVGNPWMHEPHPVLPDGVRCSHADTLRVLREPYSQWTVLQCLAVRARTVLRCWGCMGVSCGPVRGRGQVVVEHLLGRLQCGLLLPGRLHVAHPAELLGRPFILLCRGNVYGLAVLLVMKVLLALSEPCCSHCGIILAADGRCFLCSPAGRGVTGSGIAGVLQRARRRGWRGLMEPGGSDALPGRAVLLCRRLVPVPCGRVWCSARASVASLQWAVRGRVLLPCQLHVPVPGALRWCGRVLPAWLRVAAGGGTG
jgi:hypothetical protein